MQSQFIGSSPSRDGQRRCIQENSPACITFRHPSPDLSGTRRAESLGSSSNLQPSDIPSIHYTARAKASSAVAARLRDVTHRPARRAAENVLSWLSSLIHISATHCTKFAVFLRAPVEARVSPPIRDSESWETGTVRSEFGLRSELIPIELSNCEHISEICN